MKESHRKLLRYLMCSITATVVDVILSWGAVTYSPLGLIASNTLGVVSGFLTHYRLTASAVFDAPRGAGSFTIYAATFLLGLALANGLIYAGYEVLFAGIEEPLRFLMSKALSIVGPFFVLYYLRRFLFRRSQDTR